MTLAIYGKSRRRRAALLSAALLAVLSGVVAAFFIASVAFAHTTHYSAVSSCDGSWSALSSYSDGISTDIADRRLIVLHNAVVNGVAVTNSTASGLQANQNFTPDPDGSNGMVLNTSYTGANHSLTGATIAANDYLWVGAQQLAATLFNLTGGAGTLNLGANAWGGSIDLYHWDGTKWVSDGSTLIVAPTAPTNCAKIIVKKVTVNDPGATSFTANITNTDHTAGTVAGASFSVAAPYTDSFNSTNGTDDFSVTEAAIANWSTKWIVLSSGSTCPASTSGSWTSGATATGGNLNNVANGDTAVVCFLNTYTAPSNPTISKARTETTASGGLGHWNITINNTQANAVDRTLAITDSGATLASVTATAADGSCVGVPDNDGNFTCTVKAGHTIVLHVTTPVSAASNSGNTCLPGTMDNGSGQVSAQIVGGASITVTFGSTSISVPGTAAANCLTATKVVEASDYKITVHNSGPATSVLVKDTFAANGTGETLGVTSVTPSQTCTTNTLTTTGCTLTVASGGDTIITIPWAAGPTPHGCDNLQTDNSATATFNGTNVTGSPTTPVHHVYVSDKTNCVPGLTISKSGPATATQGGALSYTITVGNSAQAGASTSGTTTVTDLLPNGLLNASATGTGWSCTSVPSPTSTSTVTCTSSQVVNPGAAFNAITVSATLPANVCGDLFNAAQASGGGDGTANSNTVTTTVNGCLSTLTKAADNVHTTTTDAQWTITINNSATGAVTRTIIIKDANPVVGADPSGCTGDITAAGMTCTVNGGTNLVFNVHHSVTATCQGGSATNSATAQYLDDAGAPHDISATNATNISVTIPGDTSLCNRHIVIVKKLNDNSADSTLFPVTLTNDTTGGSPHNVGVSTASTDNKVDLLESSSQTHDVTETVPDGYVLDGYYAFQDTGDVTGRCVPANITNNLSLTPPTIPADGNNWVVCIQNHKAIGHLIIEKDNIGGDQSDAFSGSYGPGTFSGLTPSNPFLKDLPAGTDITVHEDAAGGYDYIGYSLGHCVNQSVQVQDQVIFEPAVPVAGDYSGSIVDAQTIVVCLHNQAKGHIIVAKVNIDGTQSDVFTAHVDGGTGIPFSALAQSATQDVAAGSHAVSEDGLAGYTAVGWAIGHYNSDTGGALCTDISPTVDGTYPIDTTSFNVAAGQTVVVCFINDGQAHIQVVKVDGTGGLTGLPANWTFSVTGPGGPFPFTIPLGGGNSTIVDVPVGGTYSAVESNGNTTSCPNPNEDPNAWRTLALDGPQTITTPGQTIVFHFSNQPCDIILGSGNLIIHKYGDLNGNHVLDAGEVGLGGWTINIKGPQWPAGQDFVTDSSGTLFKPGITDGVYTITETNQAGYTVIGVVNVNTSTFTPGTVGTGTVADGGETVVNFFNQPLVNIHVTKTEVSAGGTGPGAGWAITVKGCGNTYGPTNTNASGVADFNNLPPCATGYTVSENTLSKAGFVPVGASSVVVAGNVPGTTYNVSFENQQFTPGCTVGCTNVTPTPTPPTPTTVPPTATPTQPTTVPPTATPTQTVDIVEGAKTPGPGTTPIAPSTGSGLFGTSGGSTNTLLALFGLFALSGGLAILALGRRSSRN